MPPACFSILKREKGKKNLGTQKETWSRFLGSEDHDIQAQCEFTGVRKCMRYYQI